MDTYTKIKIIAAFFVVFAIGIIVINVNMMQKTDGYGCDAIRYRKVIILAAIVIVLGLTLPILINKMGDFDEKNVEAVKRYEKAVDNGYKVYFNGQSASGDAIDITENTLGDYNITYDDNKKIVKIMKKDKSDWYPVFIPIFYH